MRRRKGEAGVVVEACRDAGQRQRSTSLLRTRAHIHALQKHIFYATSALRRSRKALQRKRIATGTSTGSQISRVR